MAGWQLFGRSPKRWFQIFLFYVFYYACIAAFFSATVGMYYSYVDVKVPSAVGDNNKLRNNPGMGFAPKISVESSFVYADGTEDNIKKNKEAIEKVLKKYEKTAKQREDEEKSPFGPIYCGESTLRKDATKACQFSAVPTCGGPNYGFGEDIGEPCILVWLNNIYDFSPELYECDDTIDGKSMDQIIDDIDMPYCQNFKERNLAPLICKGETAADQANILNIRYELVQGFYLNYFPYRNQPGYQQPLVFVQLKLTRFVPVIITCYVLAKNIKAEPSFQKGYEGSVRFEVMVDITAPEGGANSGDGSNPSSSSSN